MSSHPASGKMDTPVCDTHEGLIKRVKALEQITNEQTKVIQEISEIINDIVVTMKAHRL